MKITYQMVIDYQHEIVDMLREELCHSEAEYIIEQLDQLAPHFNFDNPEHESFYGKEGEEPEKGEAE